MGKRLLFFIIFFVSVSAYSQCTLQVSLDSISCNGAMDGMIIIQVSGGASGYYNYNLTRNGFQFSWQNAADSTTFPGLDPATYVIVVTDTAGCVDTAVITVTEPPLLLFSSPVISVDESVPGACDGSINVSVSGGTPPYNFSWVGPSGYSSTNEDIFNLCAGIYNLTLTDTNGCSINLINTVNSPIICDVVVNVMEQVTCPGGNDGVAEITNGSASFQVFSWDNLTDGINYGNGPITTNSNLASGWYQVTGTDFSGNCPVTVSDSFEIIEPTPFIQSDTIVCFGDSIQLSVNMQAAPTGVEYYFSVNGNATTYAIGDTSSEYLLIGNHYYTLFADTGNGLLYTCGTDEQFNILGVNAINISIDSTLETCMGSDGSISIFAFGGGGSLTYSINGGINFQSNPIFPNLLAGSYNVFVQESGACMQSYAYNPVIIGVTPINYVVDTVTTINESCCGNDGRIEIHVTGIDDSLKFSVDSGQTWQDSSSFFFLPAGDSNYVVVEDTNGCRTDWGYVSIFADSVPDIDMSVHVTDIVCNGDTNGTFRVLDPDPCYSYVLWRYTISPPYYLPIDTGTYFNGLIPGSYGVIATSNTGNCIDSSLAIVINEPTSLIQNGIAVKEVRCSNNDTCDGEITLSSAPTGGIPPYYYSILDYGNNIPFGPIGSDSTFSGLCTDSFEVTLFDANACKVIDTVLVADSTLYIDSVITTNVTCFGYNNGTAIVYVHGGYSPYNYIWNSGDSTMIVDSLSNTQYSVIVADTQNCLAYDTINISQPGELFFNIKVVGGFKPETCKGVSYDGEFYMNYQGGTAPFNWSWIGASGATNSGFGDTIPNLTFDTLTLFITDSNGCIGQPAWIHADSARVDALNALNPLTLDTIIADSILCYGTMLDTLFIVVKSGEAAYAYSVQNLSIDTGLTFSTDSFFTNLPAGNYNIEVRDTFGCSVYDTVIIFTRDSFTIILDNIKHVDCYEWELNGYGMPGYIKVHADTGYPPYQYQWDPSLSTSNEASNLPAGMQTVSVFYTYGIHSDICMKVDSFMITEPQKVISLANVTSDYNGWGVSCFGANDGSAFVHTQGGTPYTVGDPYTYSWREDVPINPILSTDSTIASLSAGTYIVSIRDSLDCPSNYTITILEPNAFLINILSNTPNPCFGDALGELTLTASGGTVPYSQYFAEDVILSILYSTSSPNIIGLTASDYDIWAMDANGCLSNIILQEKIGEPGEIQISASSDSLTCFGSEDGVLELTLIGGTSPYEYVFSEGSSILTFGNINQTTLLVFDNLAENTYTLNVLDNNGCPKTSVFILSEPVQIIAAFISSNTSGQKTFTVNLTNTSQGADVFYWDYDDGNQEILSFDDIPTHSYNQQGQYEIMLVAENSLLSQNCNDTTFVTIDVQGFDVFNVFSPNNDGVNDIFHFDGWSLSSMYVEIYNRWGEKIYHWDSPNGSWNGKTYNNDDAPDGVYYFFLKANGEDGYLYQQQGSITLLR